MLSNLVTATLLLAALAAVACFSKPEPGPSVCRETSHRVGLGELVYCPICDR